MSNRLITSTPKVTDFIRKMPKELGVTEDVFISNCTIGNIRLDKYLSCVKFSQMVKA